MLAPVVRGDGYFQMSVKISGKVWELDIDATEKIILLALAEYADHEGNNVRPGNSLLVAMTGLTQQTISTKITKFIEVGILDPDEYEGGRGALRQFTIDPSHGKRRQYFIDKEQKKLQRSRTLTKSETYKQGVASEDESYNQGVPSDAERYNLTGQKVQSDSGKVQSDSCAYKEVNRHEPLEREALSVTSLICQAYQKVITNQPTQARLQQQIVKMKGATVAEVQEWLALNVNLPKLNYIAEDFKIWQANRQRRQQASPMRPVSYHCPTCQDSGSISIFQNGELARYADCPHCQAIGRAA